uniref:probable G protein-coupled receptor 85 isoform X2 n=1 Tax=Myxine glutinosa TaxID=7769 RepID=UPI00358FD0CB
MSNGTQHLVGGAAAAAAFLGLNSSGPGPAAASVGKLSSLGLIISWSAVGNLLVVFIILKERTLWKVPYYFLLDLCVADLLRSLVCFPFVLASIAGGGSTAWAYGPRPCKYLAFTSVLFCFHAAFMLFCVSVTRYIAVAHHRFYSKRMTSWTCAAIVFMAWILSIAMAFPPVFDVGTYAFIAEEDQCIFEHRYFKENDSLGFMLMLVVIVFATQVVYLKLILFVYDHRKMKPVQLVPAISQNWTFHGPGATGQAAANWIAGFGRGPTPPTLVGIRPSAAMTAGGAQNKRLLVLDDFKTEKRLGKMFYIMTLLFLLLWAPYVIACYWRVFVKACSIPSAYLSAAVWLSFAQAGVNPFVCFVSNKELRRCLYSATPYCHRRRLPVEAYYVA